MKTLVWLFGFFFCFSSAYGQKTVTIEGDIRNMQDTVRFFCAEMKGNGMKLEPEDQEEMVNGKFKFVREVDKTTKMYLSFDNTGYSVWVKPGAKIKITGEAPYIQNWLAESDILIPEQVELNRFREAVRDENVRIHDLTAECMKLLPKIKAKDSVAQQEFASIRETVNSIRDQIILPKELLLMLEHPITDAGVEELRDAAKSCQAGKLKDKALVVSVYSKLTDEQKQSRLGEEIASLLSISSTIQEGDKIADAELKDSEGNIHHLSDYKGKYILLDFWSRYCAPCLDAFPLLKEIAEKHKEKLVIISLSVDPESVWKETEIKESADNWLHFSDGLGMSGIAAHYGIHALPSFIYISPESTVLKAGKGYQFLSKGLQAQERVIEQPAFDAWSSTTLEIDKIVLSDTATVFYIDAYFLPKNWIQIVKETTLQADGKTYPIKAGDGITLSEKFWMPESGETSFRLIFPPLPKETKNVDFIEGDEEGAFKIWNIHLDGSPAYSSLAGKKNPAETSVLEKPEFKNGTALLKGHIADYKPEMKLQGRAWNFNLLNGSTEEYSIAVQPDGNFTLEVPLYYPTSLNVSSNFMSGQIYLKPGETTFVEINMPEICRSQSRKQKDKPSLGEKYYFTGALAALNNESSNSSLRYVSVSPKTQEDYMQMFSDISTMNADQFKAYWMDRYRKEKAVLDSHTELSDAYRTLLHNSLKKDLAEQLLSVSWMTEYAYRTVNQIPRDSVIPEDKKVKPTIEYYDFIPELVSNDPYLLYDGSFTYLISNLQYTNFTGENNATGEQTYDNTADLIKIMGTDKGILFDLLAAQRLSKPIKEFRPLSDEEIALAGKISPVIQEAFTQMNNKLKLLIEENKKKSGYTVNRVNIADIPAEELFNAITTPYRGKVVFVDFWATWCGPCIAAMKKSEPVKDDFVGKDIVFLYLAGENSPKGTWEQMIPDIKGEHYRMTDAQWTYICNKFGVQGVPSYMIIAKDGTPTHFQVGFMGADKMKEMLMTELDK